MKKCKNKKSKHEKKHSPTLCWKCQRAARFIELPCPWAAKFEPVDGWKAEQTVINVEWKKIESYLVIDCPLFIADRRVK